MPPEETVMTRESGAAFSSNGITNSVKVYVAATLTEKLSSNLLRRKQRSTPFVNGLSYQDKLFVRTLLLYRPVFKLLREIIYKQQMAYPSAVLTRLCSSTPALLTYTNKQSSYTCFFLQTNRNLT
jgi:hypothetical protein